MSEQSDMQEILRKLQPSEPNSRPKITQDVFDWELASKTAAKYRDLDVGKAAIVPDDDGVPHVSLILQTYFARELIDIYTLYKAGELLRKKRDYKEYGAEWDE